MSKISNFLKKEIDIFNKYNIIYHSIDIQLKWNDNEQKLKKIPIGMPYYKNKKINCIYESNKNGLIIPLGEKYNGLIGVDVDNKNDTINFFNELAINNKFDLITLSVKTINNGMHYYFKLSDEQQKSLSDFMASTALCFTSKEQQRNIDIKYNNQIFFGSSYLTYDNKIYKYEIDIDTEPVILPNYLYQEILRIHNEQKGINNNSFKIIKEIFPIINNKQLQKSFFDIKKEFRIRLYLNCLNEKRFDNRDEWLIIGSILFNENCSFELFEEYSKKSLKYDYDGCIKLWNSFTEDREKKTSIKRLIELAEQDTCDNYDKFVKIIIQDKEGILELLFNNGPSDLYMSYLFYNLNSFDFVYDNINNVWYTINEYGIYKIDNNGDSVMKRMDACLIRTIKQEYIRLLKLITDDTDTSLNKSLFKKYQNLIKYCSSIKNSNNLLSKVRLLYTIDKIYEKMDAVNPNLIGFENGVYDLETFTFRNAIPEEYISVTTGYKYSPANSQLKIEAMNILKSIMPDENELNFLLKKISIGLYGGNPLEKFYIWIGKGGNGKGLLRDIISIVLGQYYDTMDITYLYKTTIIKPDAPNPVMAKKKNSRFVISSEPEGDVILKSSTIKSLSGNDPQQVRAMYGNPFNYTPKFKLIIQTNNEPIFYGFDGGMKRRAVLINFPISFVENPVLPSEKKIDITLKKKIMIDKIYLNEFFEIFVDYYKLYIKEGLLLPVRFENDTLQFIKNNDPIGEWIESNIIKTTIKNDKIKASKLYNDYIEFMDGDDRGISQLLFKNTLSSIGILQYKKKDGNYYVGIKLKKNNEYDFDE